MTSIVIAAGTDAGLDQAGTATDVGNFRNGSFQFYFTGLDASDGKAQVQVSNDNLNDDNTVWTTLSELEQDVAYTDQSKAITIPDLCFKWYRPRWEDGSNTTGTVKVTANFNN